MDTLFVVVAFFCLFTAITAVTKVRTIGWAVWLWFFSGWMTGELAAWCLLVQGAFVALWVLFAGTDGAGFGWGLSAFLATWALLLMLLREGFDTGHVFQRALRTALGTHFIDLIPAERRARLTQQIHSSEWLRPFRFKRPAVRYARDIAYGDAGRRNWLDVYMPATAGENRPVLMHVHGGAWMVGNKTEQGQPLLHRMVESGWVGVSINYRLAPRDAFPAQIHDVKKALAWVKAHIAEYGGDPGFIVVTGGSAGGHLSLLTGLSGNYGPWQQGFEAVNTSVQGVLALYPAVDFTNRHGIRQQNRMDGFIAKRIIQKSREEAPELFEDGSPIGWIHREGVAESAPPICVVQGTHDSLVWVEEARQFVAELSPMARHSVTYAELPFAQHAFEIFHSPRTAHYLNAAAMWLEWVWARHRARQPD